MKPISESYLITWLEQELPTFHSYLTTAIAKEHRGNDETLSAYFVLSYALKPHIEHALDHEDTAMLARIFALLEYLATAGDAAVQNDLGLMTEEMSQYRHRIWPSLGPIIQQREFDALTWFPMWADRTTPRNTHVDRTSYQRRWREEIANLGGFERLTIAQELRIRFQLVQEFQIVGLRAPEPDGIEWRDLDLPWPIPKDY
jgi:hypothetical protein